MSDTLTTKRADAIMVAAYLRALLMQAITTTTAPSTVLLRSAQQLVRTLTAVVTAEDSDDAVIATVLEAMADATETALVHSFPVGQAPSVSSYIVDILNDLCESSILEDDERCTQRFDWLVAGYGSMNLGRG